MLRSRCSWTWHYGTGLRPSIKYGLRTSLHYPLANHMAKELHAKCMRSWRSSAKTIRRHHKCQIQTCCCHAHCKEKRPNTFPAWFPHEYSACFFFNNFSQSFRNLRHKSIFCMTLWVTLKKLMRHLLETTAVGNKNGRELSPVKCKDTISFRI